MELLRDTTLEAGFHAFQVRPPQDALVVVVKATFELRGDGGTCALAGEQRPVIGDVYDDEDPNRILRYATDLAALKTQGEFLLTGTCHPPGGSARTSAVSARVGPLAKTVAVFGDRRWNRGIFGNSFTPPEPFTSMPLGWERSFGGPTIAANPLGMGINRVEGAGGPYIPLPHLEHPQQVITAADQKPAPANLGPVSPLWAPRSLRTGTYDKRWRATRWPWYPEDFDYQHLSAASDDQQLRRGAYFNGDEELQLKNLHPQQFDAKCRLPGLRARAFVAPVAGGFREVNLHLDTLYIDADAWQVVCVWRGLTEISHPLMRDLAHLFVAHDEPFTQLPLAHFEQRYRAMLEAPEPPPPPVAPVPEAPIPPPAVANDNPADEQDELDAAEIELDELMKASGGAPPSPPAPPTPSAADTAAAMAVAGLAMPEGVEELMEEAEDGPEPEPPAPPPERALALRHQVQDKHSRGESLAEMDLTGADLSELDLRGADFTRAVLKQANLMRASLEQAVLEGAVLVECVLTDTNFRYAKLTGADLTRAGGARTVFESAYLDEVIAHDADLANARFTRTSMKKSEWSNSKLDRSDLSDALLDEADFTAARLHDCTFARSSLVDAVFERAEGERVDFTDAVLLRLRAADERTRLPDAVLRGAKAEGSLWSGARLERANFSFAEVMTADFSNALLVQAVFDGAKAKGARFDYASMVAVAMRKTDAMECNFEGADVSHGDLRGANLYATQFYRANTSLAQFTNALTGRSTLAKG